MRSEMQTSLQTCLLVSHSTLAYTITISQLKYCNSFQSSLSASNLALSHLSPLHIVVKVIFLQRKMDPGLALDKEKNPNSSPCLTKQQHLASTSLSDLISLTKWLIGWPSNSSPATLFFLIYAASSFLLELVTRETLPYLRAFVQSLSSIFLSPDDWLLFWKVLAKGHLFWTGVFDHSI